MPATTRSSSRRGSHKHHGRPPSSGSVTIRTGTIVAAAVGVGATVGVAIDPDPILLKGGEGRPQSESGQRRHEGAHASGMGYRRPPRLLPTVHSG